MAKPVIERPSLQQSNSSFNFSSPHQVHQLDHIPTPVLKLLVIMAPALHVLAQFVNLIMWRTQPQRTILVVLLWITVCLWTWQYLAFGLPSLVIYKLARDWFSIKLTRARREALEQHSRPDGDEMDDESELYISRKIRTDSTDISLDDTLEDVAVVNAFLDHVRLRWKQLMIHLDGTRKDKAVAVLTVLGYIVPIWAFLCWWLSARIILASFGTFLLVVHSPGAHVIWIAIQKNIILRHCIAAVWAYGIAIVSTLFGYQRKKLSKRQRVKEWISTLLIRAKKEKSKAIEIIEHIEQEKTKEGTRSEMIFQFEVYENQRWWLGVNWTTNMMPSERGSWTDKQLKPIPPKEEFELPEPTVVSYVQHGVKKTINKVWSWVDGDWWVDMTGEMSGKVDHHGWEYGNNAWKQMSGTANMQTFTRRRCWCRRARLVEREIEEQISEEEKKEK
ncbi:Peroxin/Dysferlin domain-containing protein [Cokeromyces recurvatus]|uniref:Peroxin/Dysferlin domain-containing protein n=1 Tax=Cokeromyces recurvatus TaxID=90255 RepID=UPI002220FD9B|nr:Peroxin/Dysferlin domain-containing protein [Cokeromyces recurvatus]KAI7898391.1 Peroxin/Dysferlin domain-containing protein [Cokeromyces recurvatus]